MIPKQLQNPLFRFILIAKNKKIPIETSWQTLNNHAHNSDMLINHMKNGGNYGVATGYGKLVVLDFDSKDAYNSIHSQLPDTFAVLSAGKQYPHLYYIVDQRAPKPSVVKDHDKHTLIDVQGQGRQVVGPGSKIGDRRYKIWRNVPIARISYQGLMNLLGFKFPKTKTMIKVIPKPRTNLDSKFHYDICNLVTVRRVAERLGTTFKKAYHGNCPLNHSSEGGVCFHVNEHNEQTWYCYNCFNGGNIITLVAKKFNFSNTQAVQWIKKEFRLDK